MIVGPDVFDDFFNSFSRSCLDMFIDDPRQLSHNGGNARLLGTNQQAWPLPVGITPRYDRHGLGK